MEDIPGENLITSSDEDNDLSFCQREFARVHDSTSNISDQRDSARLQVEQNEEYNDVLNTSPCDSNVVKVPGIVSDVTEQDDSPHSLDEDNDLSSCQREVARVHDSTSNISEQRDSARLQDKNEGGNLYTLAKEREFSLMPKNTHDKDINECPVERLNIGPVPPEENDRMVETMHREKDNKSNEIPQLQNDASTQTEAENQEMETTNKNLQAMIVHMKKISIQKEERNRGLQNTNKSLQGTIDWMKTVSKLHKEKFFRQQRISYECGKHETLKQVRILEQENKNLLKKAENKDAENKNLQATIDIMKDMSKRQSDDVLRIKHEDMKKRSLLESTQIQNDLYTEQNKQYVAEIGELQKQIKICDLRNMILEEALHEFGNSENRLMAENIVLKKELKDMRKELIHYQEKMQRQQRIIHQSGKRETLEQMHILGQSNENLLKEAKNKDEIITTQKHQIQQCKSDFKGVCKTNHRYLQQIADMAAALQTYRETTEECCQKLKL